MEKKLILQNLVLNEEFARQTLPYIKEDYFQGQSDKVVFKLIRDYIEKYNAPPTKTALFVDLGSLSNINESIYKEAGELIDSFSDEKFDFEWLVGTTEKWCQERALYNALYESISIIEDRSGKKPRGVIPELLTKALSVSFNASLGHDYIENAPERYEYYHAPQHKTPFDIKSLDDITNGGPTSKSLVVFMAPPGGGKTMLMCNLAANHLMQGLNVLYITLEMAKEEIAKRIDANMLDYNLSDIINMEKDVYDRKIQELRERYTGKIIVEEYPTSCAGASHFRHLIHELRIKKNFSPQIVYVDYLNICSSSRVKISAGLYQYVLCISEELRGLAQEQGFILFSATQMNREGLSSDDPGFEHVSQSIGLPATCDFLGVLIPNEDNPSQIWFKQLKNRWGDIFKLSRFPIGVDRDKYRMFHVEPPLEPDGKFAETDEPDFEHLTKKFKKFTNSH